MSGFIVFSSLLPFVYAQSEIQIPIESDSFQNSDNSYEEESFDYNEDFFDVTEEGVFDTKGNLLEFGDEVLIEEEPSSDIKQASPQEDLDGQRAGLIDFWSQKHSDQQNNLLNAQGDLSEKQGRSEELSKEIEELEQAIAPLNERALTLEDQIEAINANIRYNYERISVAEKQLAQREVATIAILKDLQQAQDERDIQAEIAKEFIGLLNEQETSLNDLYSNSTSTVKLLFTDDVSENLMGLDYLKVMEETGREVFYQLEEKTRALVEKKNQLSREQGDLNDLLVMLNQEKEQLKAVRASKDQLLEETRGEQQRYQELLQQHLQEQMKASVSVQSLRKNIEIVRAKLELLNNGLNGVRQSEDNGELGQAIDVLTVFEDSEGIPGKPRYSFNEDFIWPVNRAPYITAYFKDPNYPYAFEHNAVDMRASQRTEVFAAQSGYVYQVKLPTSLNYSYILIVHPEYATVYGHMNEIFVKEGDVVRQGDVIGLSGGAPGSLGAGMTTTGPHLHFEVMDKFGNYIDPLSVLPLNEVPLEQVPDKYLANLKERILKEE